MDWIRTAHPNLLLTLDPDDLLALLQSPNPEVQRFAANALENAPGLATLGMDVWKRLLTIDEPTVLQAVCDAFDNHVADDRLSTQDCVGLACARQAPVARLGTERLKRRTMQPADHDALTALCDASAEVVQEELATFALDQLGSDAAYETDRIMLFLDATKPRIRRTAWDWMQAHARAHSDATLWARLAETPYGEMRTRVVDALQRLHARAIDGPGRTRLWTGVLLDIHRGSRQKPKAIAQLCDALVDGSGSADELVPVLAVAVRSVRRPEMRAGLSGLVRVLDARPDLAPLLAEHFPHVTIAPEDAI